MLSRVSSSAAPFSAESYHEAFHRLKKASVKQELLIKAKTHVRNQIKKLEEAKNRPSKRSRKSQPQSGADPVDPPKGKGSQEVKTVSTQTELEASNNNGSSHASTLRELKTKEKFYVFLTYYYDNMPAKEALRMALYVEGVASSSSSSSSSFSSSSPIPSPSFSTSLLTPATRSISPDFNSPLSRYLACVDSGRAVTSPLSFATSTTATTPSATTTSSGMTTSSPTTTSSATTTSTLTCSALFPSASPTGFCSTLLTTSSPAPSKTSNSTEFSTKLEDQLLMSFSRLKMVIAKVVSLLWSQDLTLEKLSWQDNDDDGGDFKVSIKSLLRLLMNLMWLRRRFPDIDPGNNLQLLCREFITHIKADPEAERRTLEFFEENKNDSWRNAFAKHNKWNPSYVSREEVLLLEQEWLQFEPREVVSHSPKTRRRMRRRGLKLQLCLRKYMTPTDETHTKAVKCLRPLQPGFKVCVMHVEAGCRENNFICDKQLACVTEPGLGGGTSMCKDHLNAKIEYNKPVDGKSTSSSSSSSSESSISSNSSSTYRRASRAMSSKAGSSKRKSTNSGSTRVRDVPLEGLSTLPSLLADMPLPPLPEQNSSTYPDPVGDAGPRSLTRPSSSAPEENFLPGKYWQETEKDC